MKSKVIPILIGIAFSWTVVAGQNQNPGPTIQQQKIILAKQSAIDNFDAEVQGVQYVEVRSFVRYQVARWLWQKGKDDTGYASPLAVKAFDELWESNKTVDRGTSDIYYKILTLLELNSPEAKKKLVEKYHLDSGMELNSAFFLLGQKDQEKLIADKLISSFENDGETSGQASALIGELSAKNSAELPRILRAMLEVNEQGRVIFSAEALFDFVEVFRNPAVPDILRERFYRLVVQRGYGALGREDSDLNEAYNLIYAVSGDISTKSENLISQMNLLKTTLGSRLSQQNKEYEDIFERIEKSADKLKATIAEAESTQNKNLKEDLYIDAINLAQKTNKLQVCLDLVEKLIELRESEKYNDSHARWYDQRYRDIALQALKMGDFKINKIAVSNIKDNFLRADVFLKMGAHFSENKKISLASETLKESLKLLSELDNNSKKIGMLLRLITLFQKVDKDQVFNAVLEASKAIDSLPPLDNKDANKEADAKFYLEHIDSVLAIDTNLLSNFNELIKTNKSGAIDFASRINKKEFKIVANCALLTNNLESLHSRLTEGKN